VRVWLWALACFGWVAAAGWLVTTLPDSPLGLLGIPFCIWFSRRCTKAIRRAPEDQETARWTAEWERRQAEQEQARQQWEAERQARRTAEIDAVDQTRLEALVSGDLPRPPLPPYRSLPTDEWMHFLEPAHYDTGRAVHAGDFMVTNRGLYFTGDSGHEVTWARIQGVDSANDMLEVRTTTGRGTLRYRFQSMTTLLYAWGTVHGALQIANRLAVAAETGQRDSRHITPEVRAEVWRLDGGRCRQCQASEYLELDHVIPWSLGGATSVGNLQLLCRRCNQAKGNRI
jgi:hypothetical protein